MSTVFLRLFLTIFICTNINFNLKGQSKFWSKIELEASYSIIDGWVSTTEDYSIVDNDGQGIGLGIRYNLKNNFFTSIKYLNGEVYSIDLQDHYRTNSILIHFGKQFDFLKSGRLGIKLGYGAISQPNYWSIVVRNPITQEPRAQHNYSGNITLGHLSTGLEYIHPLSKEVGLGLSAELYSALFNEYGYSYFSLFAIFKLTRN